MPRTLTEDELPEPYDKLILLDDLTWGDSNPRNVSPSDELQNSIDRNGFENAITVWDDDGRYEVTDGWQRYQAASNLGIVHLPCILYDTKQEAMKHGRMNSLGREWTKYNEMTHYVELYRAEREQGASHEEAIQATIEDGDISSSRLERYISIFELPLDVHELLKEFEYRDKSRLKQLDAYSEGKVQLLSTKDKLCVRAAHDLAQNAELVTEDRVKTIACAVFSMKEEQQREVIRRATEKHPRTKVEKLVREVLSESRNNDGRLSISGTIYVDPEVEEEVAEHLTNSRTDIYTLIGNLLEEFVDGRENQYELHFDDDVEEAMGDLEDEHGFGSREELIESAVIYYLRKDGWLR